MESDFELKKKIIISEEQENQTPYFIKNNTSFNIQRNQEKIKSNSNPKKNCNLLPLTAYKEYFKTCIKYNDFTKNRKNEDLNKIYLKCRNKYQSYVTNIKNSHGLKLHGSKSFENIPLKIFNNNYILNTSNISKELQDKGLEYFFPYYESNNLQKSDDGEKIKLTPIPYKNRNLIDDEIEKSNILTAERSAVFMRRLEYTHLIKKNKLKDIDNPEYSKTSMNLTNKLCLLKGAVLIIEDWWKNILIKKAIKEKKEKQDKKNQKINCKIITDNNDLEYSINFTQSNQINYNKNNNNILKVNKINNINNNINNNRKQKYTNLYLSGQKMYKYNSVKGPRKLKVIKYDYNTHKNYTNNTSTEYNIVTKINNNHNREIYIKDKIIKQKYNNDNNKVNDSNPINFQNIINYNEINKKKNQLDNEDKNGIYIRYLTPKDLSEKVLISNNLSQNKNNKNKKIKNIGNNKSNLLLEQKKSNNNSEKKNKYQNKTDNKKKTKKIVKSRLRENSKNNNYNNTSVNNSINTDLIKKIIKENVINLKKEINKNKKNNINLNNNLLDNYNKNSKKEKRNRIKNILPLVNSKQSKK